MQNVGALNLEVVCWEVTAEKSLNEVGRALSRREQQTREVFAHLWTKLLRSHLI